MALWSDADFTPDLVLIDGRFRSGCLAACALHCRAPLTVLFDDCDNRPGYHAAGTLFPRVETVGRMARFQLEPRNWTNAGFAAMLRCFFSAKQGGGYDRAAGMPLLDVTHPEMFGRYFKPRGRKPKQG